MRIRAEVLRELVDAVFRSAGCGAEEARRIAEHFVESNLTGHDSHGLRLLASYVEAIRAGGLKLGQHARIIHDGGAVLIVDGGLGAGQVVAGEAMELAIARAKAAGAVLVALRNAHHIGRVGAWAEQCAEAGCVSIHFVNVVGHPPHVAPFGGSDGRLSTNPFSVGIPVPDGEPLILDMATSKVAYGKIVVARHKGVPAPAGALLDAAGRPTTDPAELFASPPGALLPFGEHKGFGLALMCDILGGALTGGGTNRPGQHGLMLAINNMLSIVLDPGAFVDRAWLKSELDALIAWVKASPPQEGVGEVLVAGEPERRNRAERLAHGIEIDPSTWQEVREAAASVGCSLDSLVLEA